MGFRSRSSASWHLGEFHQFSFLFSTFRPILNLCLFMYVDIFWHCARHSTIERQENVKTFGDIHLNVHELGNLKKAKITQGIIIKYDERPWAVSDPNAQCSVGRQREKTCCSSLLLDLPQYGYCRVALGGVLFRITEIPIHRRWTGNAHWSGKLRYSSRFFFFMRILFVPDSTLMNERKRKKVQKRHWRNWSQGKKILKRFKVQ